MSVIVKCPRCGKEKAIVHPTFGVLPGKRCQARDEKIRVVKQPEFYSISKKDRVEQQRDRHAKDTLQPWIGNKPNPDFVKAYPEQRDNYFSKEELKKV